MSMNRKPKNCSKKSQKDDPFNLVDFLDQLKQIKNMGGIMGIMTKLPGMNQLPGAMKDQLNDKKLIQIEAIIYSMTKKERLNPDLIRHSRKNRIALGSGTTIQAVNALLKQFDGMKKMMAKMSKKGGMKGLMRSMGGKFPMNGGQLPF